MRVSILLQITGYDGAIGPAEEVVAFEKVTERPENLGLSIVKGKAMLAAVQTRTVLAQAEAWSQQRRCCPACGARRRSKGSYPLVFRALYGDVGLSSPRLHRCPCQDADGPATVSPFRNLIPGHVAPERLYLEARWSSLAPYATAAGLLADVLPIASGANRTTVREHALRVAERAEAELGDERPCFIDGCPAEWEALPIPEGRIVAALDGGYVRNWDDRKSNFELIVGRSVPEDRAPRYFGLAHGYDQKPKRRLFEVLKSQGLQANQDVTFLTDGGEEVRALTELVAPQAEHVLDWFHITMRLTVLSQYARGVAHHDDTESARLLASLDSIKWLLWHGNQHRAGEEIAFFEDDVDGLEVGYPNLGRFKRVVHEFVVYIASNAGSRPYRKNDQAWVEQKNGAVVRHTVGYRRYEGLEAAAVLAEVYRSLRLFVNFFQPSFKLASKSRDGAKVTKRYHPPATPHQRLISDPRTTAGARARVAAIYATLDPVQLLNAIRSGQQRLVPRHSDYDSLAMLG